mmetsp:Transcript_89337/g.178533  ORF Transcript_89337/g.178533 Transcript_89337/m.178533 type:complete len:105 (+) Transcript_89337:496-810(+)
MLPPPGRGVPKEGSSVSRSEPSPLCGAPAESNGAAARAIEIREYALTAWAEAKSAAEVSSSVPRMAVAGAWAIECKTASTRGPSISQMASNTLLMAASSVTSQT